MSSESFWTTLFAMFVLHIGSLDPPRQLTVWHCTDGSQNKWYTPRKKRPSVVFTGVKFDDLTIEPSTLSKKEWPGTNLLLSPEDGGFSPDVVIRVPGEDHGKDHFIIIENKITYGACLQENQMINYPRLIARLIENQISFDFLFLQSAGCSEELARQALCFQKQPWADNFGILLWEQVLREMDNTHFAPYLPIKEWQKYSEALDTDCAQP